MCLVVSGCVSGKLVTCPTSFPTFRLKDGVELVMMVTATFGQALAAPGKAVDIIVVLILYRFLVSILTFFLEF